MYVVVVVFSPFSFCGEKMSLSFFLFTYKNTFTAGVDGIYSCVYHKCSNSDNSGSCKGGGDYLGMLYKPCEFNL